MSKILCAAIWFPFADNERKLCMPKNIDCGFVVAGRRHSDCFHLLSLLNFNVQGQQEIQGFLTTDNLFKNRQEAAIIALEQGQIKEPKNTLFSEDLY